MIKNLQALRFVFSFTILVSHLLGHKYSTFGLGEYGVDGFFVLSGFVLSVAYGHKIDKSLFSTRYFFIKQWLKLYPLHICTFILAIFYEAYYGNFYEWYRLIPPVFLVQSWIPNESFHYIPNGSSWSLCGFFFFYLLFSALYIRITRIPTRRLLVIAVAFLALYVALVVNSPEKYVYAVIYTSPLLRLPDFILGIVLYRLFSSDKGRWIGNSLNNLNIPLLTLIEVVVLLSPLLAFIVYGETNHALRCVSLFWIFVAVQLLLFSWIDGGKGLVTRLFHSRAMMFLGSISFEIYLIHMFFVPTMRSIAFKLGYFEAGPLALLLLVTVIIPTSYIAKKYFVDKIYESFIKYVN